MAYTGRFGQSDDFRREELIRKIEHGRNEQTPRFCLFHIDKTCVPSSATSRHW